MFPCGGTSIIPFTLISLLNDLISAFPTLYYHRKSNSKVCNRIPEDTNPSFKKFYIKIGKGNSSKEHYKAENGRKIGSEICFSFTVIMTFFV